MYFPLYLVSPLLFSSIVHNVKYNLWLNWERQYTQDTPLVTWKNYINFALSSQMASEVWTYHCSFSFSDERHVVEMQNVIWYYLKHCKNIHHQKFLFNLLLLCIYKPTDRSTHVGSEDNVQYLAEVFLPLLDLGSKCGLSGLHNRSFYLLSHFTTSLSMFL